MLDYWELEHFYGEQTAPNIERFKKFISGQRVKRLQIFHPYYPYQHVIKAELECVIGPTYGKQFMFTKDDINELCDLALSIETLDVEFSKPFFEGLRFAKFIPKMVVRFPTLHVNEQLQEFCDIICDNHHWFSSLRHLTIEHRHLDTKEYVEVIRLLWCKNLSFRHVVMDGDVSISALMHDHFVDDVRKYLGPKLLKNNMQLLSFKCFDVKFSKFLNELCNRNKSVLDKIRHVVSIILNGRLAHKKSCLFLKVLPKELLIYIVEEVWKSRLDSSVWLK
jgi:hypothetical protein